ncbi:MAG: nickel-dependent hydrogenase large subunit [Methylocystis sp.]|uniref:nickel-dependent hydrogenase large subunit n=1 Tax=Methylocystis sp. TaxID=1911079 RepID=UPI003DA5827B
MSGPLHPGAIRISVQGDGQGRVADVCLQSSRPAGATRLFLGRPAQGVPTLAGSLFSLCGLAHGAAARLALSAAADDPPMGADRGAGVAAERLVETLRATALGWPSLSLNMLTIAGPLRDAMTAARALNAGGASFDPARALETLEKAVAAFGLGSDRPAPGSFFDAMLSEARSERIARAVAPDALVPADDMTVIHALRAGGARFAAAPVLSDRVVETGPFARHWREARDEDSGLAARLAARFADIREALAMLRAAVRGTDAGLCSAGRTGEREGYGAVETARGRLYHWARLDKDGRVLDYEMLAPTEWNFHPEGPFVAALKGVDISARDMALRRVGRLAALFDPCVAFEVELREAALA